MLSMPLVGKKLAIPRHMRRQYSAHLRTDSDVGSDASRDAADPNTMLASNEAYGRSDRLLDGSKCVGHALLVVRQSVSQSADVLPTTSRRAGH